MTPQEIFNKAYLAIMQQGEPSIDPQTDYCLYRGTDDLKCAVGHLITDDEYSPVMENLDVEMLLQRNVLPDRLHNHLTLLSDIQEAHDKASSHSNFCEEFDRLMSFVAFDHLLTIPETPE